MALPTEGPNDERRRTVTKRDGIASDPLPPQAAVTPQDELVAGWSGNPESIPSQALLAQVLDRANLRRALKQVRQNKGAPGLDGMTVEALPAYLRHHWLEIREQLETGSYPSATRQARGNRQGGREETPAEHPDGAGPFHTASHRAGHFGAMGTALSLTEQRIPPETLGPPGRPRRPGQHPSRIPRGGRPGPAILLRPGEPGSTHGAAENPLPGCRPATPDPSLPEGWREQRGSDTPHDARRAARRPLSSVLANAVLDEPDWELDRRGHCFARYANDGNILVKSKRAGERAMASVTRFVSDSLRLTVNPLWWGKTHRRCGKSAVDRPMNRKFLGFTVSRNGARLKVADKALDKLKDRVRELTRRTRGTTFAVVVAELRETLLGWKAYFGITEVLSPLRDLDKWVRRKLRCYLWKQWGRAGIGNCANAACRCVQRGIPASPPTVHGGCRRRRPCRSRSRCLSSNKWDYRALRCGRNLLHRIAGYVTRSSGSVGKGGREAFSYPD